MTGSLPEFLNKPKPSPMAELPLPSWIEAIKGAKTLRYGATSPEASEEAIAF